MVSSAINIYILIYSINFTLLVLIELRIIIHFIIFYRTPDLGYDFETNSGRPFNYFSYGVAVSEVEIDCLTGSHKVMPVWKVYLLCSNTSFTDNRIIDLHNRLYIRDPYFKVNCLSCQNLHTSIVMDVGKSLNPALDIGQVFHLNLIKQITPLSVHHKYNLICGCVCRLRAGSCKV